MKLTKGRIALIAVPALAVAYLAFYFLAFPRYSAPGVRASIRVCRWEWERALWRPIAWIESKARHVEDQELDEEDEGLVFVFYSEQEAGAPFNAAGRTDGMRRVWP